MWHIGIDSHRHTVVIAAVGASETIVCAVDLNGRITALNNSLRDDLRVGRREWVPTDRTNDERYDNPNPNLKAGTVLGGGSVSL